MFAPKVPKPQTKAAASSTSNLAHQRSTSVAHQPGNSSAEQTLFLQRSIGNQATPRYLTNRLSNSTAKKIEEYGPEVSRAVREAPGPSWDFSKIPVFPPDQPNRSQASYPLPGIIQPKLAIGEVSDPLEHEADRVADQVMRMPAPDIAISSAPLQVSRKCAACEEAEKLKKKPAGPQAAANEAPAIVHQVLRSPGQPLDDATRTYFEPRFGLNFGAVRTHTNATAMRSAAAISARAYTYGSDIVFAKGERPGADRLTAHELAHVTQNVSGGAPAVIRRSPATDPYEIISRWNVFGRDVAIVRVKADGRTFFFYRRSGHGPKGKFAATAPKKDAWVPFEGFEEVEKLRGETYQRSAKFHKEPYYYSPDVAEGRVAPGYGTQTNQDIAEWLDNKLPPGTPEAPATTWEVAQAELDKINARNLPYPGKEAPQPASAEHGEIGARSGPPPDVGSTPQGGRPTGVATTTGDVTVPQIELEVATPATWRPRINISARKVGFGGGFKAVAATFGEFALTVGLAIASDLLKGWMIKNAVENKYKDRWKAVGPMIDAKIEALKPDIAKLQLKLDKGEKVFANTVVKVIWEKHSISSHFQTTKWEEPDIFLADIDLTTRSVERERSYEAEVNYGTDRYPNMISSKIDEFTRGFEVQVYSDQELEEFRVLSADYLERNRKLDYDPSNPKLRDEVRTLREQIVHTYGSDVWYLEL
jgi:hypothetical protein